MMYLSGREMTSYSYADYVNLTLLREAYFRFFSWYIINLKFKAKIRHLTPDGTYSHFQKKHIQSSRKELTLPTFCVNTNLQGLLVVHPFCHSQCHATTSVLVLELSISLFQEFGTPYHLPFATASHSLISDVVSRLISFSLLLLPSAQP